MRNWIMTSAIVCGFCGAIALAAPKPQADPGAEEAYAAMQRVDGLLTPQAKTAWRWRQLYLRALLDAELKTNGGKPNERCNEAFAELINIYHAENADPALRSPLPKNFQRKK